MCTALTNTHQLSGDRFAEVLFYFAMHLHGKDEGLAMLCPFSPPDEDILTYSLRTVLACTHLGDDTRQVVSVHDIVAVVAMIPLPLNEDEASQPGAAAIYASRYFVVEKPGLEVAQLAGRVDDPGVDADGLNLD